MGDRYFIDITCPNEECRFHKNDVYYAPTCGFVEWVCPRCGLTVDLSKYTGISKEDASNLDVITSLIEEAKVHELEKRLADRDALFLHLIQLVKDEELEAARQFIEVDIESYVAREGTPALDKVVQQDRERILVIVGTYCLGVMSREDMEAMRELIRSGKSGMESGE